MGRRRPSFWADSTDGPPATTAVLNSADLSLIESGETSGSQLASAGSISQPAVACFFEDHHHSCLTKSTFLSPGR